MLFKIFKVDETSERSAFKVSIFNLILTSLLTLVLISFVFLIFHYYDEETAVNVSRVIWIEAALNLLFFPFDIVLALGVKRDRFRWIKMWIRAKIVQASYIFLLNFVIEVYITAYLNVGDGLIVLVYTVVIEVFYMENIVYMNNYHRNKTSGDTTELPEPISDKYIINI